MSAKNLPARTPNHLTSIAPRRSAASAPEVHSHEQREDQVRQQAEWDLRANETAANAGRAFEQLLSLVETGRDTGQVRTVAAFIAAVVGLHRFDIYDLRALDVDLSDDVLVCIDAIRWRKSHLADLVPDGFSRAHSAAALWGFTSAGPKR